MTLNKALLAAFLTIIALLIAGFVYVKSIDFNQYKAVLVEELREASGRDIAVDGDISLSLGVESAFVIDGLRIGNPDWATRDDMIRVGRIEARFPLAPLLAGEIHINRLVLYDVDLWLETNGPAHANWYFIDGGPARREIPAPAKRGRDAGSVLGLLGVGGIDLAGARVTYRNAENGAIQVLELTAGSVRGDGFSKPMELEGEGVWIGLPLSLRGKVGSLEDLVREGGASYKVDLATTLGGVQVTASGNLANPDRGSGVNLAIKARADSLQGLSPILGEAAGRLKHMTLNASVTYIRERFVMGDVRFGVSDSSMTGNLSVDFAPSVPVFDAVFNSPRIDLSALFDKPVGDPAMAGARPAEQPSALFSRDVLPWRALDAMNGRLTFRGSAVQVSGVTLRGVDFDAILRDGVLTVAPFHGKLAESEFDANATLARAGNGGRFALAVRAPRLSLGSLVERVETVRAFDGVAELSVQLSGTGDSVAGLAGTMYGAATLSMGHGKLAVDLPGAGEKALAAGPGAIFGMLVPKQAGEVALKCAGVRISVRDGMLRSVGSVVESDAAVVVAGGEVDFAKERFDLRFSPRSKGPALWLATPVQIKGPLSAPRFGAVPGADPANEGGALSPLAQFFERLLNSSDNACLEAVRRGAGRPARRAGSKSDQAE